MGGKNGLTGLMLREFKRLASRRIYWFMMLLAPVFCFVFFADLLKEGLPMQLPIAVVDEDNTSTSRQLSRSLDAIAQTDVVMRGADFSEARKAMQKGEIYGIFHIPADFAVEVATGKRPVLSFYTNETYLLPSSLAYKDMRLQAALANGAVQQTLLKAKGITGVELQARLLPVTVDTNPLNNPWISYAIYLASILIPSFISMFAMFVTSYSITEELKDGSCREWLAQAGNSMPLALAGKLLPQMLVFLVTGLLCLSVLYGYMRFPLNSGFLPMFAAIFLLIAAAQGFAVFITGLVWRSRIVLSFCALWSVLSFSISGFTFPVPNMPDLMRWASNLSPIRHYYLLYVDQALNGVPVLYSWGAYVALGVFALLPFLTLPRLKRYMEKGRYLA